MIEHRIVKHRVNRTRHEQGFDPRLDDRSRLNHALSELTGYWTTVEAMLVVLETLGFTPRCSADGGKIYLVFETRVLATIFLSSIVESIQTSTPAQTTNDA